MAASYPTSVKSFTNPSSSNTMDTAGVYHDVQHADANNEITAIETEIGVAPKTITDATSPAATPTSVAQYLDMVATHLKAIVGGANWYTAVTNSLADFVTHLTDTTTHGTTGDIVGTSDTQTLTNKTLTTPIVASVYQDAGKTKLLTVPNTASDTLTANAATQTLTNKTIVQKVTTYTPDAAGTATLDLTTGNIHSITMPAGNITIAISNEVVGQCFIIEITQDGGGSRTVTWFTTIRWAGGSAPTLTTTASKRDTFGFRVTGTDTYDGFFVGQNI